MKVLWLGNSDDAGNPTGGSMALARQLLEARIGEPVELTSRMVWPSDDLPAIVDRWMTRYEPDVVMFKLDGYWYLHNSLPVRVERLLGKAGGSRVRVWGERAVRHAWFRTSLPYRAVRALATRSIGTATNFTKEYTADVTERCIRAILSHEGVGLTVWGQTGRWPGEGSPAGAQEWMYRRMSRLCSQLHVSFVAWNPDDPAPAPRGFHGDDPLHRNESGHEFFAAREANSLLLAWNAIRTGEAAGTVEFETNEVSAAGSAG